MKTLLIFIVSLGLGVSSATAQTKFYSYNLMSCGDFMDPTRSELQQKFDRATLGNFVRGYLTAYNFYNANKQIQAELPDNTIKLFAEKFCRSNPLQELSNVAPALARELGAKPIP